MKRKEYGKGHKERKDEKKKPRKGEGNLEKVNDFSRNKKDPIKERIRNRSSPKERGKRRPAVAVVCEATDYDFAGFLLCARKEIHLADLGITDVRIRQMKKKKGLLLEYEDTQDGDIEGFMTKLRCVSGQVTVFRLRSKKFLGLVGVGDLTDWSEVADVLAGTGGYSREELQISTLREDSSGVGIVVVWAPSRGENL